MSLKCLAALALPLAIAATPAMAQQKEAIGMMTMLSQAPDVCKWTDANSTYKLDQLIDTQVKANGISADEWRDISKQAKATLLADPANCADPSFRALFDEATK